MSCHAHNTTANEQVRGVELTKGADPSGTHSLQRQFVNDLLRRLQRVRGLIAALFRALGDNDTLQLSANADPEDVFDFPTERGKIEEFIRWLRSALQDEVIEPVTPINVRNGDHWTAEYLQNAYVIGAQKAQGRLMQAGVSLTADTQEEILNKPVSVRQLQEIYTRAFENLKGITDDIADTLRTELTEAIQAGENPRKVANRLNKQIEDISNTRAVTLARTEIINSHADATVTEYEQAGADVVTHTSRMTAKDASVCPFCRALDGVPFTLREFQNVVVRWGAQVMRIGVPAHPNGRCSPMPEVGVSGDELESLDERIPDSIRGKSVSIINR